MTERTRKQYKQVHIVLSNPMWDTSIAYLSLNPFIVSIIIFSNFVLSIDFLHLFVSCI